MSRRNLSNLKENSHSDTNIKRLMADAFKHHSAGRLEDAARIYRGVLALDNRHADCFHLLGLIYSKAGLKSRAVELIEMAISLEPCVAAYYCNLGNVMKDLGRLQDAKRTYERALALSPKLAEVYVGLGHLVATQGEVSDAIVFYEKARFLKPRLPEVYCNLGCAKQQLGLLPEALEHFKQAVRLQPSFAQAHYGMGTVLHAQGLVYHAKERYESAIRHDPRMAEAYCNLGNILTAEKRYADAEQCFQRALTINSRHADFHYNYANTLQVQWKVDQAIVQYEHAIELRPGFVEAILNLGKAFERKEQQTEAISHFRRALALKPNYVEGLISLGSALSAQSKYHEALELFAKALSSDPGNTRAYGNLSDLFLMVGNLDEAMAFHEEMIARQPGFAAGYSGLGVTLLKKGEPTQAREYLEKALKLDPEHNRTKLNLAMLQLLTGDLQTGWKNYESRKEVGQYRSLHFIQPQWGGEALSGARILIHAEQGLGDTLQFLRYVPMVVAAGGTVVLEVPASLRELAARIPGVAELISFGEPLPSFEKHCPLMSLPLAFKTTLETIPATVPYLVVPQEDRLKAASFFLPSDKLRVGIVWTGSSKNFTNRERSLSVSTLEPLRHIPGVRLFSLQLDQNLGTEEHMEGNLTDLAQLASSMTGTAAVMEHLDLIISVDTSLAHLAGALGRPTWLLLHVANDWRWLEGLAHSPWYPTMRLFRQTSAGDWSGVISRVADALNELSAQKKGCNTTITRMVES